ncbi:hypothetical protein Harman_41870 [Haloarcula mannanilytica]|uniref:Uncharacterized protein n=1 Tax=Haloarcula mannanilytica TaxID=2509225 RepID=A0A4C2EPQ9_9EURY|nr:hypothetical protein Harman_41870 [Haloarcula mannanilytica]
METGRRKEIKRHISAEDPNELLRDTEEQHMIRHLWVREAADNLFGTVVPHCYISHAILRTLLRLPCFVTN